jgi:nucleotide-binding universal stress UspA family protein
LLGNGNSVASIVELVLSAIDRKAKFKSINEGITVMFEKILIALGNAAESQVVLGAGLNLAEKLGAKVLLLHVMSPLTPTGFSPLVGGMFPLTEPLGTRIVNDATIEQYAKEWQESERQGLEQLQADAKQAKERGIEVEISQNLGDSGRMICEVAKSWSADAIVMGRNQKSMLSEIWLGSTSNYVLHHAPCSTLVIQLPREEGIGDRG